MSAFASSGILAACKYINRATALVAIVLSLGLMACATTESSDDQGPSELNSDAGGAATEPGLDDPASTTAADPMPDPADPAAAAAPNRSLFERAGGKSTLDSVSSDFVDMLGEHPAFAANPAVSQGLKRDPARHKQMLSDYLCRVSGGPCKYTGKNMKDAHAGMKISASQWTTMGALFIKALRKNNVPKPERGELATLAAANRPLIVDGP